MVPRAIKKSDRSIEDALPPRLSETWSLLASVSQYGGMCRPERLGILFGTLKTSTGLATFGHGQCKVGGKSEWVVCKSM